MKETDKANITQKEGSKKKKNHKRRVNILTFRGPVMGGWGEGLQTTRVYKA